MASHSPALAQLPGTPSSNNLHGTQHGGQDLHQGNLTTPLNIDPGLHQQSPIPLHQG